MSAPLFLSSSAGGEHSTRMDSQHGLGGAHGWVGAPITSWHAARSAVCFFGASRRILCRALEMKTCIVRCSSASGGEPGTAGVAPDIVLCVTLDSGAAQPETRNPQYYMLATVKVPPDCATLKA